MAQSSCSHKIITCSHKIVTCSHKIINLCAQDEGWAQCCSSISNTEKIHIVGELLLNVAARFLLAVAPKLTMWKRILNQFSNEISVTFARKKTMHGCAQTSVCQAARNSVHTGNKILYVPWMNNVSVGLLFEISACCGHVTWTL